MLSRCHELFIRSKRFFSFLRPKEDLKRVNLFESNNYNPNGIIFASDIIYPGKTDIKKCYTCFNDTHQAFMWQNSLK